MPEEGYGNLGVTVPVKTDKPIAIPSAMKTFADSVGKGKGKGKLLVAQNTGGALFKEMKGDATLAEDGTLTLSKERKPVTFYPPNVIATEQSVTSPTFAKMSTPDQISDIVIPSGGLIVVHFAAMARRAGGSEARIAIFLDSTPIHGAGTESEGSINSEEFRSVSTASPDLTASAPIRAGGLGSTVAALALDPIAVAAAAGTHTVSIQYRAASGTVVAKERTLWAEVHGF